MFTLDSIGSLVLSRLFWTSLQAVVLVGAVALVIRLLPRIPAAARCALWWLVGLQVVVGLCTPLPISVPLLEPAQADVAVAPSLVVAQGIGTVSTPATTSATHQSTSSGASEFTATHWSGFPDDWRLLLFALWLLGLAAQIPGMVGKRRRLNALIREARPAVCTLQAECDRQAHRAGLRRLPTVRESSYIDSPMVAGIYRPVILWPRASGLDAEESALALAHELAHLRRRDLCLAPVAAAAEWLFFFHPLVRYAVREYAVCREAACDAAVLRQGVTPHAYGSLLVRIGVQPPTVVVGLASGSPTFRNLKQRLRMLDRHASQWTRVVGWTLAAVVLAAALPYRFVAAAARPVDAVATTNAPVAASIAARPLSPPAPPPPQVPPAPPPPPQPPSASLPAWGGFHAIDVDVEDSGTHTVYGVALFGNDSVLVRGDEADLTSAKQAFKDHTGPMVWFRHNDVIYMSRNRVVAAQAQAIYAPYLAARRKVSRADAEKWEVKGPLEGLRARQASVDEQVHTLRTNPGAPAAAARLASLERQQARITSEMERDQRKLDALEPQQAVVAQYADTAAAEADVKLEALMVGAASKGEADRRAR